MCLREIPRAHQRQRVGNELERDRIETGKVWLVGAGPGDQELLTVKGRRLLEEGDCFVYDRLVGGGILGLIPAGRDRIDVGKKNGRHTVCQEEINEILIREAKKGKKVIRLKGGDPFLFGRGGEEAEALAKQHIPFEVVPGISSAIAVPAYGGIPVTHRDFASGLHIVTAHPQDGKAGAIPYEALVKAGGTLVFLMGVSAIEMLMEGLCLGGMDKTMPAVILEQGTLAGQRKISATVGTLAAKAREEQIKPPAVIVVGQVCALESRLQWYEHLPLAGKRILVTRPRDRGFKLQRQLQALGAEVLSVPTVETVPVEDASEAMAIRAELERLQEYDVLAFTSPYGVERFFDLLWEAGKDARAVSHMKFAAIGQGTADALAKRGLRADYMPKQYDGVSLGRLLAAKLGEGTRILLARSSLGTAEILRELDRNKGITYRDLPVYRTRYAKEDPGLLKSLMEEGTIDCAVFTSSSTVEGFLRMFGPFPFETVTAVCIGQKTQEAAQRAGMRTAVSKNATTEDLVDLISRLRFTGAL